MSKNIMQPPLMNPDKRLIISRTLDLGDAIWKNCVTYSHKYSTQHFLFSLILHTLLSNRKQCQNVIMLHNYKTH
jgi:hypothetical protein